MVFFLPLANRLLILMCTVAIYTAFSEVFCNFSDYGAWPGESIATLGFFQLLYITTSYAVGITPCALFYTLL